MFCQNAREITRRCVVLGRWQCKSLYLPPLQTYRRWQDWKTERWQSCFPTVILKTEVGFSSADRIWRVSNKSSHGNLPFRRHPGAASAGRTGGTSSARGIPRLLSSNTPAITGNLHQVLPGVDDVAPGLIRMRKHWFSVKVQKSFHSEEKSLRLSVASYFGFPPPSQEIILWSTWSSRWEASTESGLAFRLNSKEIKPNLQRRWLSYTHCFPKSLILASDRTCSALMVR